MTRVCEFVAEEYKLEELEKVNRVGSDEAEPDKISDEQYKIEKGI